MKPLDRPDRLAIAVPSLCLALAMGASALGAAELPAVRPDANATRASIPEPYRWQLDALFADDAAFEATLKQVAADRARLASFEGSLADAAALSECLELYFRTRWTTNRLTLYAQLRYDSHQDSTGLQAMRDRALQAMSNLIATAGFIRQELLALDDEQLRRAYDEQPRLAEYRPYVREIRRRRARVLGPEAERVLALAGDNLWAEIDLNELPSGFEKAFGSLLVDIPLPMIEDEQGRAVQLTLSNFARYRGSADRRVRRDTVERFFATLRQYRHALASTFAGQVDFNIFLARSRGYDTALEAYLDKDEIAPEVYRNLIRTIHDHLEPLHDYVALRKQLLGVDELHIYDLYAPLVPGVEREIPYLEARRILPAALEPLGPEYLGPLATGLDPGNGWIDVYPHAYKDSGAFSASVYGVHPFIKMNYYDRHDDLSTLAHEYGHAIHSFLSNRHQPYVTSGYPPFLAEIASTTNEKLLSDHLLAHSRSDEERLSILGQLVEDIRTTIYRQTLFAEFELRAHTAAEQGTPLTADFLEGLYRELIGRYYGEGFTIGENDDIEWAYVPHFYYKFYMMSYATGLASGIALAERIERQGPPARDAYLGMLKAGKSKPPLELLREAGVDLTRPAPIVAATELMGQSLARMRALLSRAAPREAVIAHPVGP